MTTNKDGTTVYTDVNASNKPPVVSQTVSSGTEDLPKSLGVNALTGTNTQQSLTPPTQQTPQVTPTQAPPPVEQPVLPVAYTPRPETKMAEGKSSAPALPKTLGAKELVEINKVQQAGKTAKDIAAAQKKTGQVLGQQGLADSSIAGQAMNETDLAALEMIQADKASFAAQEIAVNEQLRKEGIENFDTIMDWIIDNDLPTSQIDEMMEAAQSGDWASVIKMFKDNQAIEANKPPMVGDFAADDTAGVAAKAAEYKAMGGSSITVKNSDGSWSVKPLMMKMPDGQEILATGADELARLQNDNPGKKITSTYNAKDNTVTYTVSDEAYDPTKLTLKVDNRGQITYGSATGAPYIKEGKVYASNGTEMAGYTVSGNLIKSAAGEYVTIDAENNTLVPVTADNYDKLTGLTAEEKLAITGQLILDNPTDKIVYDYLEGISTTVDEINASGVGQEVSFTTKAVNPRSGDLVNITTKLGPTVRLNDLAARLQNDTYLDATGKITIETALKNAIKTQLISKAASLGITPENITTFVDSLQDVFYNQLLANNTAEAIEAKKVA